MVRKLLLVVGMLLIMVSSLFAQDSTTGSVWAPVLSAVGALLAAVAATLVALLMNWLKKKL